MTSYHKVCAIGWVAGAIAVIAIVILITIGIVHSSNLNQKRDLARIAACQKADDVALCLRANR